MSHVSVAVSTALCIASSFGEDVTPGIFSVEVPSWEKKLELVHCDPLVPESFEPSVFDKFGLCHAGMIAVQKNAPHYLSSNGLNIFFCAKGDKRFLVLVHQGKEIKRQFFATLPAEYVGQKARFFLPNVI